MAPQRFATVRGARVAVRDVTIVGGSVTVADAQNQVRQSVHKKEVGCTSGGGAGEGTVRAEVVWALTGPPVPTLPHS